MRIGNYCTDFAPQSGFEMLCWMGGGYGRNAYQARKQAVRRTFERKVAEFYPELAEGVVLALVDFGDPEEFQSGGPYTRNSDVRELAESIVDESVCWRGRMDRHQAEAIGKIASKADVLDWITGAFESDWGRCDGVFSPKEYEAYQEAEEFKRLGAIASSFAASCGHSVNTMEFLRALDNEVRGVRDRQDDWNDGEARMERMGACVASLGSSYGAEIFHDDNNFENGRFSSRIDDLSGVFGWLEAKCPLLMAQYHEQVLAGTWAEEDEE